MKIIKRGKKVLKKLNRVTCEKCGTMYDYDYKDVNGGIRDYDGTGGCDPWVDCPVCKKSMSIGIDALLKS